MGAAGSPERDLSSEQIPREAHLNHLPMRWLMSPHRPDKDVAVIPAVEPSGKAVLFIHGYGGSPTATWNDFHSLLPRQKNLAGADLYFYGYDGIRAELLASSSLFRNFLDRTLATTSPHQFGRTKATTYDTLIIVCHSLGAVVARRALIDATRMKLQWVGKVRLTMFAPAHMGARIVALVKEMSAPIRYLPIVLFAIQFRSPLIEQLDPKSEELAALKRDIRQLTKNNQNPHLRPRSVLIAEYERIVSNSSFPGDPPATALAGHDHFSVCKPRLDFLDPIETVVNCL